MASVFLMSVDSARPEATNTCTLLISFLRSFLSSVSLSDLPGVGDHFARVGVDGVDGEHAAHRALTALDRIGLVAEIDRHVATRTP